MFTLFSGGSSVDTRVEADGAADQEATADAVSSVRAVPEPQKPKLEPVAVPPPPVVVVPQPTAPPKQQQQDEDEELDEFDPYVFIRSLPPHPPPLHRPICLPKKTRGTFPVSLILDLDETLLHSSIVPLPTYDVVFPVHFNAVNYQVYVRKRPHMDYFLERVSQMFEIIIFTASQKVRPPSASAWASLPSRTSHRHYHRPLCHISARQYSLACCCFTPMCLPGARFTECVPAECRSMRTASCPSSIHSASGSSTGSSGTRASSLTATI
jgi:hypothetical protein